MKHTSGWIALAVSLFCFTAPSTSQTTSQQPANPSAAWQTIQPEDVGYSSARLEALHAWLKTGQTSAMIVVVHGKIIFQYGDLAHASNIASIRKSILGMLYGNYVVSVKIDAYKTVKQLGLDDNQPFLPIEEKTTLERLMTAGSGIYLPSGDNNLDQYTPKRGSQYPGTFFDYNNWDFNAAGTAFEKLTGKNIYDALQTDLAQPLHMQDYDRAAQHSAPSPASRHPGYPMSISARDLARIGLLMLRGGVWDGKSLLDANWIRYMTTIVTPFSQMYTHPFANPARPTAGDTALSGGSGMPRFIPAPSTPAHTRAPTPPAAPEASSSPSCPFPTWLSSTP